jgi:hypothetical protein
VHISDINVIYSQALHLLNEEETSILEQIEKVCLLQVLRW